MKRINLVVILILSLLVISCSKRDFSKMKFNDGTYEGVYINDGEHKDTMKVNLEIKDGRIVNCTLLAYDEKSNLKDENYAKEAGQKNYEIAQRSVSGMNKYPQKLLEVQDPELVDAESGATVSYKEFKEAVWIALEKAKK